MGKTLGILAIIVVIVVAVFLVISFTGGSKTESNSNTTSETESNLNSAFLDETENTNVVIENENAAVSDNENANSDEEIGAELDVAVTDSGFSPKTLTIKVGDSVTWTNERSQAVYIAPDNHPDHQKYAGIWDDDGTGRIAKDESYTMTFTQAGSYTYHDHLNSSMTGTVVVTE